MKLNIVCLVARRLCIKVGRGQGDRDIGTRVWGLGTWGRETRDKSPHTRPDVPVPLSPSHFYTQPSQAFDWGWILEDEVEQKRRAASLSLFSF